MTTPTKLTVSDYRVREASTGICIACVTLVAAVAVWLGVSAGSVVVWPMLGFQLQSLWRAWREWRARRRRKALEGDTWPPK